MATAGEARTLIESLLVSQPMSLKPRARVAIHGGYYVLGKQATRSDCAALALPGFCHSLEFATPEQQVALGSVCAACSVQRGAGDHSCPLEPHLFNFERMAAEGDRDPQNWTWEPGCGQAQADHYNAMAMFPLDRPSFDLAVVRDVFQMPAV